jgi:AcrR family transcriptional regulator
MRKIADEIEYTAPIIYEYFANKDAILMELTRKGFLMLAKQLEEARDKHRDPAKQLEAMWMTYWNFAFAERELYQLMYGVRVSCCEMAKIMPESEKPMDLIWDIIVELMLPHVGTEEEVCTKYYTFWSVIHGLISINMVNRGNTEETNQEVLKTAITGIIRSIKG